MAPARTQFEEILMTDPQSKLSRRRMVAGVGTVGALATAAVALPMLRKEDASPEPTAAAPEATRADGYRETPHVLRYYQTARV
jgi:hypothetical protein